MMGEPQVTAVILNTNRKDDTLVCLESLECNTYPRLAMIVLDNASTDGSVDAIRERFPKAEILPIEENKGYAGNNNIGIQAALDRGADWVLVLNEDTILDPLAVSKLVEYGETNPKAGILGPLVHHYNDPEVIQSAGGKMDQRMNAYHLGENELDHGQYKEPLPVDWVSGCAIMVRRQVIEQAGLLDERFYYYWEETEWCLRARENGWQIYMVPAAKLWHKGVQIDYKPSPSVTYYYIRNHLLLQAKHHAPIMIRLVLWFALMKRLVSWTVKPRWRDKAEHRNALVRAMLDYIRGCWGKM
jgi:GT2 family glycosyltransferase